MEAGEKLRSADLGAESLRSEITRLASLLADAEAKRGVLDEGSEGMQKELQRLKQEV